MKKLRIHVTIGLAQVLLAESVGKAISRSAAVLWAEAWGVGLEDGAALAAQSRHVADIEAQGMDLESAAALSARQLAATGVALPGSAAQPRESMATRLGLSLSRNQERKR